MDNIKTEPSSHDNDDDPDADMASSSSSSIINTATSIHVKKKDEDHDNDVNDYCSLTTSSSRIRSGLYVRNVKKEEDDENDDDKDEGSSSFSSPKVTGTATAVSSASLSASSSSSLLLSRIVVKKQEDENDDDKPTDNNCNINSNNKNDDDDDDDDPYADWKVGNWCWVLPSTTCDDEGTTTQKQQTQQDGTTNNHSVKSEEGGDLYTSTNTPAITATATATATVSSRKRTTRSRNTSVNNEDKPKKKLRVLPPLPPHHTSNTNGRNNIVKREKDSGCDEEVRNPNVTDFNDIDNNKSKNTANNDADADDDGYKSWTTGNWCWVLPNGRSTSTIKIRTEQQHSSTISSTNTSLCVDDQAVNNNNEYDTAYSDSDDGDNDDRSKKSRTERYKKWQNKKWNDMFRRLVLYKRQYNSTSVPKKYAADLKLARWVHTQRTQNEVLSEYRMGLLNSIGFVLNALDDKLDKLFQRLVT